MDALPVLTEKREKDLLWFFDLALLFKAVDGVLEFLGAILILAVPPSLVLRIAEFLTVGELAQDPHDFIATTIRDAAHAFTVHTHYFIALYLAFHGAIKVALVIGVFAGKRIAYPLFMIALAVFGAYEAYRGFQLGELLLQALAVFDLALLVLTSYEYRRRYPAHSS
ncbi:MAG: hypothetical protein B7X03_03430 [Parcubacteria group bacterium 21-58-10]|nr:MAG: hypothetical protein B7X03_03430 [Parcubacteria group bacterium 21-58-10]